MEGQFLSGMFNKLVADPSVANRIRYKNLLGQIKDPTQLDAFSKSFSGLKNGFANEGVGDLINKYGLKDIGAEGVTALADNPWKGGNAGEILKGYAGAHPMKTLAGAGLGLANISGLMDNDYWGGQALGALAGGLGSAFLTKGGFSPMVTMAGGAVGSLFDKLREKQQSENQQYYR